MTSRLRLQVLIAALCAVVAPVATAHRVAAPDPCGVSTAALNAALAAPSDTPQFGTPGTKTVHGFRVHTCSWTYGNAFVVISLAPKALAKRPPAVPAGTRTSPASGLGAGAKLLVNTRSGGSAFVAATFVRGPYWAEVWGSGGVTSAHVLRLARFFYKKL
jgi:hypothetical protein